jgi:hypothetical protein
MRHFEMIEVESASRAIPRLFPFLAANARRATSMSCLGDACGSRSREPEFIVTIICRSTRFPPTTQSQPIFLTTQALEIYFRALKPDGTSLMLRHFQSQPATRAGERAAGGCAGQSHRRDCADAGPYPQSGVPAMRLAAGSQVMLISKSAA